jgi:hypothetical protein
MARRDKIVATFQAMIAQKAKKKFSISARFKPATTRENPQEPATTGGGEVGDRVALGLALLTSVVPSSRSRSGNVALWAHRLPFLPLRLSGSEMLFE